MGKTALLLILSLSTALFSFLLTFILLKILIPVLKSHKMGQKIYDIGPRWHKSKEGTPIMGGVCFIIPALLLAVLFSLIALIQGKFADFAGIPAVILTGTGCGLIGFIDDYTKLIKKQNQGLRAWQKLALQLVFASVCVAVGALTGRIGTTLRIPFTDVNAELGFFYYIFLVLFIAAVSNAVNLTDGIDGLASSVSGIIVLFFAVFAFVNENGPVTAVSAAVLGGCAGFLMYNFYPARIFMGDTGSLYLGGIIAALCIEVNNPLIVLLCGIIFVIEELSVILQVGYFKLTHGKRLFKMAPIHHHFEKCGWKEVKIVAVFSALTLIGCIAAWFGM